MSPEVWTQPLGELQGHLWGQQTELDMPVGLWTQMERVRGGTGMARAPGTVGMEGRTQGSSRLKSFLWAPIEQGTL